MIIITGGAGFIGSVLAAELEQRGMGPLVIVDHFGGGTKWKNLRKRQLYDLVFPRDFRLALERYRGELQAVFHLGAISDTSASDGDAIIESNVRLSFDLWDWCSEHGVPLIYASSAATYGDGANGFDDDRDQAGLAALRPLNLYGWSKHVVDRRFFEIASMGGPAPPRWCGFKLFNVYGPNEYHKGDMQSAVVKIYDQVSKDGVARLFKSHRADILDGSQQRDFVWVDDAVDAMIWALGVDVPNGIYNLGSGQARTFADLAGAVSAALQASFQIEYVDMPSNLKGTYQYFTEAKMKRLRDAGWKKNTTSLESGVQIYVRQFLMNADPYR